MKDFDLYFNFEPTYACYNANWLCGETCICAEFVKSYFKRFGGSASCFPMRIKVEVRKEYEEGFHYIRVYKTGNYYCYESVMGEELYLIPPQKDWR